ncbi:hypothetical protein LXL04_033741 [Taraxacum kok-saghyz]
MAVAEIFLAAFITVLFEKLGSADLIKLARSEGIISQLNKWNNTLLQIQAVLADAAQKHITEKAVQLWVNKLQDLAYDIDDVLDDLATEAMRRKLNQESHAGTRTSKVLKIFPICCTNLSPRNITYGKQMSSKLDEITTKLHDLVDQKNHLGLIMNAIVNVERSNITETASEQTSLVDESKIMGREADKEVLLAKLLGNEACDQNVSTVSIIGMGGIGKTTLAKILYNEQKVKDHFSLRAWVCVSQEFDVFNISKAIFQAVNGKNEDFADLNLLHEALKEKLISKRFMLVIDDVWNEDQSKWELLQCALVGAPGSKILVTTRNTRVASLMDSDEAYRLEVLSTDDALSLFAQHALGEKNFKKHLTLKLHGEGIVKKCGRLPLALKTLGRALKTNRSGDEWENLLNSEIWDIQDGRGIFPALRLSYYHLPPHLKQLFAYCSLFPKDYVFDKKKLILMWMAEGFLSQSKGNMSMEGLGHHYFEELKSRSFFQDSTIDESGFTMHDLINDLASSVAGEFFFRLDDKMDAYEKNENFENFRHFSVVGPRSGSYKKLKELQRARRLRTFSLLSFRWQSYKFLDNILAELLPELHFLRVLSLATQIITRVPQSIGGLKHLRYLNFSYSAITSLPEEVSELYNLQSLLVHDCYELSSLPKSFRKLINLRHLDISSTPKVKKMPLGIGGLKSLQTLSKVVLSGANGFKIHELKGLSNLQGRLCIMGMEKVINPIQAKDANLHHKIGLDVLEMEWSEVFDNSRNEIIEYEVLKGLQPHHKVRNLKISFYKGMRFPSWVGDPSFDRLTELTLRGCRSTHLPTLGHLRSLRQLFVERMNEVKTVGFELLAPKNSSLDIAFPSLEVLKFDDMQGWQSWSTSEVDDNGTTTSFPCLTEISIIRCPNLTNVSIGLIPSLTTLHVEECSETVLRSMVGVSSSLVERLVIHGCNTVENYNCPINVERLVISCCDSVTTLTFSHLQELPSSVPETVTSNCDNIKPIPDTVFGLLPVFCLRSLQINNCKNLKSFPHEHLQSFTSLEQLWIYDCPSMHYSFPCGLWPPNLSTLGIGSLNKPMSQWGLQNFPTSLVELLLYGRNSGVVSFTVAQDVKNTTTSSSFHLPRSLTSLTLVDFMDVESLSEVLQQLPYLKSLEIFSCPKLKDLHEIASYPSSLKVTVY